MFNAARFKALLLQRFDQPNKEVSWSEIVAMCNANGIAPSGRQNWLTVRGGLQELINAGDIKRVPSVHVEHYVLGA